VTAQSISGAQSRSLPLPITLFFLAVGFAVITAVHSHGDGLPPQGDVLLRLTDRRSSSAMDEARNMAAAVVRASARKWAEFPGATRPDSGNHSKTSESKQTYKRLAARFF